MIARFADHDFLYRAMLEELLDRLSDVQRDLPEALVTGCPDDSAQAALEAMGKRVACVDPGFLAARGANGVQADEDEGGDRHAQQPHRRPRGRRPAG